MKFRLFFGQNTQVVEGTNLASACNSADVDASKIDYYETVLEIDRSPVQMEAEFFSANESLI